MGQQTDTAMAVLKGKSPELKKHIATIHRSNEISLLQGKINNALLFKAYYDLLEKEEHEISIKELCALIGYSGNNHQVIKDALKALISKVVEWNILDDKTGEEDWSASAILASVQIKSGMCYYAYSPRMKALLYSPTIYGKINMVVQSRFRSSYGLLLYENCVRYKGLPQTKWFDIDTFRKLMGVPDDKYTIFRDFKRRVLDKAVEEINLFSDIKVDPEIKRAGRKAVSIRFMIKDRDKKVRIGQSKQATQLQHATPESQKLLKTMVDQFGMSRKQGIDLLEHHGLEKIKEKIELIQSSDAFSQHKIHNLAGYLKKAIEENYQRGKDSKVLSATLIQKQKNREIKERMNQEKQDKDKQDYNNYLRKDFLDKFNLLDNNKKEILLSGYHDQLKQSGQTVLLNFYNKHNLESPMVLMDFKAYLNKTEPDLIVPGLDYDSFLIRVTQQV